MKVKKEVKKSVDNEINKNGYPILYKCEKCGYTSPKTFLFIFGGVEYRFCEKCLLAFYLANYPRAIKVPE